MHFVGRILGFVDDARVANHRLDFENSPFDERLLLLGIFVLRVFGDVAELFGLADALVDFAAMVGLQIFEFLLEFLETIFRQKGLFVVHESPRSAGRMSYEKDASPGSRRPRSFVARPAGNL
jgi:hypothetical protein